MAQILNNTYEILDFIGKGGMSTVFKARHIRLNMYVAVKSVRKDQAIDLLAEVSILTKLNHPNLVKVIDIFQDEKLMYIVMDYIEGEDLQHIIKREKVIPEETVNEWFKTLADTMRYLHNRKPPIIYRDMKPANVILQKDGTLKVIDFGIAREYKPSAANDTTYIGTNGFAAPEQFGLAQTDARTDIYSLGMTMFYLTTGKSPYEPPYGHIPAREINPALSEKIERILDKCTKDNPEDRYQTDDELLYDLNDGMTYPVYKTGTSGLRKTKARNTHSQSAHTAGALPQGKGAAVQEHTGSPPAPGTDAGGQDTKPPVRPKWILAAAVLGVAALIIAGIIFIMPKGSSGNTDPKPANTGSVLKVGVAANEAPFSYEFEDGIIGYSADIAQMAADRLGYSLELIPVEYRDRIDMLNNGDIDLYIGYTPKGLYSDEVEESEPYFIHGSIIVFPKGTQVDLSKYLEFMKGKKVMVSTSRDYLFRYAEVLDMDVAGAFDSTSQTNDIISQLNEGKYDCALFSTDELSQIYWSEYQAYMILMTRDLMIADGMKEEEFSSAGELYFDELVVAAKLGNTFLIDAVNDTLDTLSPDDEMDMYKGAMHEITEKKYK